jgi:hypothetical protein
LSLPYRATYQFSSGQLYEAVPLTLLAHADIGSLAPIREPNNFKGQKHITGLHYSPSTGRHHKFESRLEQTALIRADFELTIEAIATQPFALLYEAEGKRRGHIPDILVKLRNGKPLLIDVKPKAFVDRNAVPFAAMQDACSEMGWSYHIWTEPQAPYARNLAFLYGYHRPDPSMNRFTAFLLSQLAAGSRTIGQLLTDVTPLPLARPALFHLMWTRDIQADLTRALHEDTPLHLRDA